MAVSGRCSERQGGGKRRQTRGAGRGGEGGGGFGDVAGEVAGEGDWDGVGGGPLLSVGMIVGILSAFGDGRVGMFTDCVCV